MVREKAVGNVSEVVHVKLLIRDMIDAWSHLTIDNDRSSPVVKMSGFGVVMAAVLLFRADPSLRKASQ